MDEAELKQNPFADTLYGTAIGDMMPKEAVEAFDYDISKSIDGIGISEYSNETVFPAMSDRIDDESFKEVEITSSMENVLDGMVVPFANEEYKFDLTVSDPQSVSEGLGSYVLYQIQLQVENF
jgi:hypothetical protein